MKQMETKTTTEQRAWVMSESETGMTSKSGGMEPTPENLEKLRAYAASDQATKYWTNVKVVIETITTTHTFREDFCEVHECMVTGQRHTFFTTGAKAMHLAVEHGVR